MKYPFVQQETENDCGLACLAMLYRFYFKKKLLINEIKREVVLTRLGITVLELKQLAIKHNLLLESYNINFKQLQSLVITKPLIIQIFNANVGFHFVIIYKKKKNKWLVANPANSEVNWKNIEDFTTIFTNIVISTNINNIINTKPVSITKNFSPFLIPNYIHYSLVIIINNLLLVTTFFISQVFYKHFINEIILNNSLQLATILLLSFFFINLIKILIEFFLNKICQKFYFYVNDFLVNLFHNQWFKSRPMQIQEYNDSVFLQIYQDINNIATMFCHNSLEIIINFSTAVIVSIILIKIHFLIWLINLLNGFITLLINFIVMLCKKPLVKKELVSKLDLQQQVILSQKSFEDGYFRNLQYHLKKILIKKYNTHVTNYWQLNNLIINNGSLTSFVKNIISFITIYLSLTLIFNNKINLSQLIFITSISIYINSFFQNIGNIILFLPIFIKSFHRFNNFISIKVSCQNQAKCFLKLIKQIVIKECDFKLANKGIFNDLNLIFKHNNIIIGTSGIGKTSLLLLIAKKYLPLKGKILVNNKIDLTSITYNFWQKNCIYINSNAIIHEGTVLENILSFNNDKEKLTKFQRLKFNDMLINFNLTPFYYCQEYGSNLSQGQRQVIIFLSLFFYDWKVILLDEMLSNINNNLKIILITLLLDYYQKAIIIYAGHDLTLLTLFKNVINLDNYKKTIGSDK